MKSKENKERIYKIFTLIVILLALNGNLLAQTYSYQSFDGCLTSPCGPFDGNSTSTKPNIRLVVLSLTNGVIRFRIEKCSSGETFGSSGTIQVFKTGINGDCWGATEITELKKNITYGQSGYNYNDYTIGSTNACNPLKYLGVYTNTSSGKKYYAGYVLITPIVQKPTITTGNAQTSSNEAVLYGTVSSNSCSTDAWFEYGTSSGNYTNSTSHQNITSNATDKPISEKITGLTSQKTYYYRIVAENNGGKINGTEKIFTTSKPWTEPTVVTLNATGITINQATINGRVNPNGFETSYRFKYGLTQSLSNSSDKLINIGSGTTNQQVSLQLTNRSANTTYYYTIEAVSTDGSNNVRYVQGDTYSFTTLPNQPTPFSLQLNSEMGFYESTSYISKVTNLNIGKTYYFKAIVKNTGETTFNGNFYLKKGLGSSYSDYIKFLSNTIGPNGSIQTLTGTFAPSVAESNISLGLFYSDAGANQGQIIGSSYQQNITISTIDPSPTKCGTYTDCPDAATCPNNKGIPDDELYNAIQYLCSRYIIDKATLANVDENLKRQQLAKMAFLGLFDGNEPATNTLPSDNCPSPYLDLQQPSAYYYRYAKALLYLEYGDGISPFSRQNANFNPEGEIERVSVLKLLLETFNIKPATSGADFGDLKSTEGNYGYARKAFDLGIISGGKDGQTIRPNDKCTRGEVFVMLHRLLKKVNEGIPNYSKPSLTNIINGFYLTGFWSPQTISANQGIENGNFNHYSKSSFSIPGRNISMDFEHSYNSYLTVLPGEYFPINPLGAGWSHTYNAYITKIKGITTADDRWLIHWPDGSINSYLYNSSKGKYDAESNGVYDDLTEVSQGYKFELKTKNQVIFVFESLSPGVFYLTSVKDRNNNKLSISYTSGEKLLRIAKVTDGLNRQLKFSYLTVTDLLETVTDPLNRVIRFAYTNGKLTSFTDANGNITKYQYGTMNEEAYLLKTIELPKGNKITNSYYQQKLKSMELSGNVNSRTKVDLKQNYSSGVSEFIKSTVTTYSANSDSIQNIYRFNSNGMVTSLTDNQTTDITAEYGIANYPDIPSLVKNNKTNSSVAVNQVVSKGNITSITRKADGKSYTKTMTYTDLNDIETLTNAKGKTTSYAYTNGNLSKVTDPMGNSTSISNNSYGQPSEITDPMGIKTKFEYDNSTGLPNKTTIPSLGISSSIKYDLAGRMIESTSLNNLTTKFDYDNNDNLTQTTQVGAHNGTDVITQHSYDKNDNLSSILNALNRPTTFTYNTSTDWLEKESFEGFSKSYTYYTDGSLKTFKNPNDHTFKYYYDQLGRITDNGYATYSYDEPTGNIKTITKDGKAIELGYDGFNRLTSVLYDGNTVNYEYDELDNVTKITYPGGKAVTYSYTDNNQMKTVTDWNSNKTTYNYNKSGRLISMVYPNQVKTEYQYDEAGRQTGLVTKRADNSVIASYSFTLDNNGNHLSETSTEPFTDFPAMASETINYTYDKANRILTAGITNFEFDKNGNTTKKGYTTLGYDLANNLSSVTGTYNAFYTYDGTGIRRKALRDGIATNYIMDILGMGNVLMETDANGNAQNYYIHGLGLISRIKSDGNTTNYYVYDFRGSTVAITDAATAANITHQYQYDEFGKVLQSKEADLNRFRYVGKYGVMYEKDELYFMRARYYDPTIGRFLSEDPIWSTNLYPYADGNPMNKLDNNGREATWCTEYVALRLGFDLGEITSKSKFREINPKNGLGDAYKWGDKDGYLQRNGYVKISLSEGAVIPDGAIMVIGTGVLSGAAWSHGHVAIVSKGGKIKNGVVNITFDQNVSEEKYKDKVASFNWNGREIWGDQVSKTVSIKKRTFWVKDKNSTTYNIYGFKIFNPFSIFF